MQEADKEESSRVGGSLSHKRTGPKGTLESRVHSVNHMVEENSLQRSLHSLPIDLQGPIGCNHDSPLHQSEQSLRLPS